MNSGIFFALVALIAWAIDDFYIGRVTKKIDKVMALFWVALLGVAVLLPFVWRDLSSLGLWQSGNTFLILLITLAITIISALADYEALRIGKLSAIDPIYALEIPITLAISYVIIQELLPPPQLGLVILIIAGVCLVSIKSFSVFKNIRWERGLTMALLSTLFMGGVQTFLQPIAAG